MKHFLDGVYHLYLVMFALGLVIQISVAAYSLHAQFKKEKSERDFYLFYFMCFFLMGSIVSAIR